MKSKNPFFLFPVFLVFYEFTVYLANDMIMPGMIQVVTYFSADLTYIPQSLSAYLLGGASLQIVIGPFSDHYGRRLTMLAGVLFFLVCSLYIMFAGSINQFIISRFFQGMGLCFISVIGYSSIQEMYEEKEAIKLISLMSIVTIIAPLIGPLAGGIFSHFFPWQGVFVIISVLATISFLGLKKSMPETAHLRLSSSHKPCYRVDLNLLPPMNLKSVLQNYKLVLTDSSFLLGAFALSMLGVPLLVWIATSPIILIEKEKLSSIEYGLWQIPVFSAVALGNIVLQKLIKKRTLENLILIGSIFSFSGILFCILFDSFFGESYIHMILGLTFYSFGLMLANAPLTRKILFISPVAKGTVSAVISTITMIGFSIGTYLISIIYKNRNNTDFSIFCFTIISLYLFLILIFLHKNKLSRIENK